MAKTSSSGSLLEKLISTPTSESTEPIQRKSHNRLKEVRSLRRDNPIQTKLNIGEPNDKYEQEADRTAKQVVQQINSPLQAKSIQREEIPEEDLQMKPTISAIQREEVPDAEELQMKSLVQKYENIGGGEASTNLESSIQQARGSGQPLDTGLQEKMGQAMGANFSGVKVHADSKSNQLNKSIQAKAFTTGQDLFFSQGTYDPNSRGGQELIAHELTHVVQQNGQRLQRKPLSKSIQVSQIQDISSNKVQRLWNKKTFRERTKDGVLDRRGKTIKSIEDLIVQYGKLNPYSTKDLKSSQDLAKEIREHVNNWIEDHTGDKSRSTRMLGMKDFLNHLDTEEIPKLNKIETDILDKTNTTGGSLELDKSNREGNLTKIKEKHEGNMKSSLEKFGHLIDASVPNLADKSKLEIELKIPCDPSGTGFVGFHLVCQNERKKAKQLNTRCELTVTGGAKFAGLAELKAEIGGYFESEGEDSKMVMRMISYAIYRRFVESKVLPVEMSNYMWGGTTTSVGYKRAERWASKVEKDSFGLDDKGQPKKNFVETGLVGGGTASGGIKDVGGVGLSGKVGVKGSYGTRYDNKSITESRKKQSGEIGDIHEYQGRGDAQKKIGRTVVQVEIPAEGKVGIFKFTGKGKFIFLADPKEKTFKMKDFKKKEDRLDEASFEAGMQVLIPVQRNLLGGLPELIGQFINGVATNILSSQRNDYEDNPRVMGSLLSIGSDASMSAVSIANLTGKQLEPFAKGKSLNEIQGFSGSSGEIGLRLGYKAKYKPGDAQKDDNGDRIRKTGISQEIQVDYVKAGTMMLVDRILEVQQNAIDLLSIKQETLSRLFTMKYEKGGDWVINPETKLELQLRNKTAKELNESEKGEYDKLTDEKDKKEFLAKTKKKFRKPPAK
ncbi:eCIS core domain-containing protein [Pseudanabaena minima]|uniref:eCIS core domain-containing protein n=1 Tax=Pseudanabaena minima TaxID=890415 RepID=UPI003DA80AC3